MKMVISILHSLFVLAFLSLASLTLALDDMDKCSWCVKDAECNDQGTECICKSGFQGNPYFYCYEKDKDICLVCDDPVVMTDVDDAARAPYFGSTLIQDVTMPESETCNRRARFIVGTYRAKGKVYPRTVSVRMDATDQFGQHICSFAYKVKGYVTDDHQLKWVIDGGVADNSGRIDLKAHWTLYSSDPKSFDNTKCSCTTNFDTTEGHILRVRFKCCSYQFAFRPFIEKSDWLKTGVWVEYPKPKNDTGELIPSIPTATPGYPLCLHPGVTVRTLENFLELPDRACAMSYLALTNLEDDLTELCAPEGQPDMTHALLQCDAGERVEFFSKAKFMVEYPPFINCISENSNSTSPDEDGFTELLEVVTLAAEWFCQGNEGSCLILNDLVHERCSHLLDESPDLFTGLDCM